MLVMNIHFHMNIKKLSTVIYSDIEKSIIANNSIFDLKKLRLYTKETFYENHTYSKN